MTIFSVNLAMLATSFKICGILGESVDQILPYTTKKRQCFTHLPEVFQLSMLFLWQLNTFLEIFFLIEMFMQIIVRYFWSPTFFHKNEREDD